MAAKKTEEMIRRGVFEDVIETLLLDQSKGVDDHKIWALIKVLKRCGDQGLIDWTLEQMSMYRVGLFPEQSEAIIARLGASSTAIEKIVPRLIRGKRHDMAAQLLKLVDRDFTPGEATLIAKGYIGGAIYSDDKERDIAGILERVIGTAESVRFRADVKKHLDQASF